MQKKVVSTPLSDFVENFDKSKIIQSDINVSRLYNSWFSISKILTLLWVSYYLNKERDNHELNQKVHSLISGKVYKGNEYLEICARIADYFRNNENKRENIIQQLCNIDYHNLKMLASIESIVDENSEKIAKQMLAEKLNLFAECLSIFKWSYFEISFKTKKLSEKSKIIDEEGSSEFGYLGITQMHFSSGATFPGCLFPFFVFMITYSSNLKLIVFSKWDDHSNIYPYYQDLCSCNVLSEALKIFEISKTLKLVRDENVITDLFRKQEYVTSKPFYDYSFFSPNQNLIIKLYNGNMLELNSNAKKEINKKYAMVLDLSESSRLPNKMVNYLKLIGECTCINDLMNKHLSKGNLYVFSPDRLAFYKLMFCPIYNIEKNIPPDIDTIKKSIQNIIVYLQQHTEITHLICPAMGANWGKGLRHDVPRVWLDILERFSGQLSLQVIIFAFIENTALNVYKNTLEQEFGSADLESLYIELDFKCKEKKNELESLEKKKDQVALELDNQRTRHNERFAHLPYPLALEMHNLFGVDKAVKSSQSFVEKSLDIGLSFLRLSLCVFIRIAMESLSEDESSEKLKKDLKNLLNQIKSYSQHRDNFASIRSIEHGKLMYMTRLISKNLIQNLAHKNQIPTQNIELLNSFFKPQTEKNSIANIRNRIAHDGFSKSELYYSKFKSYLIDNIKFYDVLESSFFIDSRYFQLIYIDNKDITDNEDCPSIEVTYTDLTGCTLAHPKKQLKISDTLVDFKLKKERVYLFHNDVNAFRFTRLYPFILYDVCPETERNDIIVWKGFDGDSPIYQSIFYSDEITPDTTLYHDKYQKLKNDFWNTINYIEKLVQ